MTEKRCEQERAVSVENRGSCCGQQLNIMAAAFANYIEFIKAADNALKADNIRYKIKVVGPNVAYDKLLDSDGSLLTKTVSWLENAVKYNELFDIYSAHTYVKCESFETDTYNYCDEFSEQCLKAIKSTGKTLWV